MTNLDIRRMLRHFALTDWHIKRAFPPPTLAAIEQAIEASESAHDGELRFAVEGALSGSPLYRGQSARERAIDVFSQLRMWDTEHRNGVLIYLLMADRSVEIIADRGVAKAGAQEWEKICCSMETAFHNGRYEAGVIEGICAITGLLTRYFPSGGMHVTNRNELPDKVVVL